ncbi:MAG: hypothetical protein KDD47_20325 [Acidobacteria bacterium]|nr:hypothetical protein [Acidobacteriota bacterium]
MAKPLEYNATLVERIDLTPSLSIFKVLADPEVRPHHESYVAGQYLVLGLNNEERPDLGSVKRPMSIVSAPEETGPLEFYIRYVSHPESDNPLTHLLWKIKAGDRMYCGPRIVGKFTLEDTVGAGDSRLKICVAAGTGLAPFLSYIRSACLKEPHRRLDDFLVLHGASYPADLGYREEMEQLAAEKGLHYFPTVSRPKEAPEWQGDAGRVEDYFLPERLEEVERRMGWSVGSLLPSSAAVFICGLQGTIGKTVTRLLCRGFVPENKKLQRALGAEHLAPSLFFEQYDTTPVVDLKDEALMADLRRQLQEALAD